VVVLFGWVGQNSEYTFMALYRVFPRVEDFYSACPRRYFEVQRGLAARGWHDMLEKIL
jgi:hypothetical protein